MVALRLGLLRQGRACCLSKRCGRACRTLRCGPRANDGVVAHGACVLPQGASGSGEHGQTREHAQLARSLGVEQLAVVVTKLDTCDYDPVSEGGVRIRLFAQHPPVPGGTIG